MNYNWNWKIFFEVSADGRHTWLTTLFIGLGWTLLTAFCAGIIALLLGSALGVMRTTPNKWLVRIGNAYVELFRNIPLLVQLFLWFFVLPELLPKALGTWIKTMTPPWAVMSPMRAAGIPPISTVKDPSAMTSGPPAQTAMSPTRAAGRPPMRTVGQPGGRIGPPTCGTGPVAIGQVCMSVTRAAGGMSGSFGGCAREDRALHG